jgi:hypothetical protein
MILACGQSGQHDHHDEAAAGGKATSDSIYNIVMEDHNVAMAKLGQLKKYQDLCAKEVDSITTVLAKKKDPALAARKEMLESLKTSLKQAEDDMDHWMTGFEPDSAGTTEESKLKYYNAEKDKVGSIKDNMLALLSRADTTFKK